MSDPLYCTAGDVRAYIKQLVATQIVPTYHPDSGLPDPTYPNLEADDNIINGFIEIRSRYIDSFVEKIYPVPITGTVPGIIKVICRALTACDCFGVAAGRPQAAIDDCAEAKAQLKEIASGELPIAGLSKNPGIIPVQPYDSASRGSYDRDYNDGSGLAVHMGLYNRRGRSCLSG